MFQVRSLSSPAAFPPTSPHFHHLPPCAHPCAVVGLIHRIFPVRMPAIHAVLTRFPQQNPRKIEVASPDRPVLGVSTSTPQHVDVLYLTRTRCGATFIFTRSLSCSACRPGHIAQGPLTPPSSCGLEHFLSPEDNLLALRSKVFTTGFGPPIFDSQFSHREVFPWPRRSHPL